MFPLVIRVIIAGAECPSLSSPQGHLNGQGTDGKPCNCPTVPTVHRVGSEGATAARAIQSKAVFLLVLFVVFSTVK